jgi:hypothetical protein
MFYTLAGFCTFGHHWHWGHCVTCGHHQQLVEVDSLIIHHCIYYLTAPELLQTVLNQSGMMKPDLSSEHLEIRGKLLYWGLIESTVHFM